MNPLRNQNRTITTHNHTSSSSSRIYSRSKSFEEAKPRYQQEKITTQPITSAKPKPFQVGEDNRDNLAGSGSFSASMDSSQAILSRRKERPQPVVRLPQQSRVTPYRAEPSGGKSSAFFMSQHVSQSPFNETTNGLHSLLSSHNQPSIYQPSSTPSQHEHIFRAISPKIYYLSLYLAQEACL